MNSTSHTPATRQQGQDTLVIGTVGLAAREETVLRVLVRLLADSMGTGLRLCDDPRRAQVVFAAGAAPLACGQVRIRVLPAGSGGAQQPAGALAVGTPLSLSNVSGALQAAMAQLGGSGDQARAMWLTSLFDRLCTALRAGGCSAMPIGAAGLLMVDASERRLQASLTTGQLLAQAHMVGEWHPATAVDREWLRGAERQSLRSFMWRLSAAMVQASVGPAAPAGAWRLLHWPTSVGLVTPGHPQLAAWLSRQPASAAELIERTGLPAQTVNAFLGTCLALDLLQRVGPEAPTPGGAVRTAGVPGWVAVLRERLRLW